MLGKKKKKQVRRLLPKDAEIIDADEYEDEEEEEEDEEEELETPKGIHHKPLKKPSEPLELRNQEVLDVAEGNLHRALNAIQFLRNRI